MKPILEKLNFDLPEMPSPNTDAVIGRFIQEQQKKEEEIFTTALRTMAEPPIKGEITKGKVRWRGIRIVQQNDGFKYTKWLFLDPKTTERTKSNNYKIEKDFVLNRSKLII